MLAPSMPGAVSLLFLTTKASHKKGFPLTGNPIGYAFPKAWRASEDLSRVKSAFDWMADLDFYNHYSTRYLQGKK